MKDMLTYVMQWTSTVRAGFCGASQGSPAGSPSHSLMPSRLRPCRQGYEIYSTRHRVHRLRNVEDCSFVREEESQAVIKTVLFKK
jgi:hypothetical protein